MEYFRPYSLDPVLPDSYTGNFVFQTQAHIRLKIADNSSFLNVKICFERKLKKLSTRKFQKGWVGKAANVQKASAASPANVQKENDVPPANVQTASDVPPANVQKASDVPPATCKKQVMCRQLTCRKQVTCRQLPAKSK